MKLIEEEEATLEDLDICDEDQFLIEVRNKDLTWPEEIGSLSLTQSDHTKQSMMCKFLFNFNIYAFDLFYIY